MSLQVTMTAIWCFYFNPLLKSCPTKTPHVSYHHTVKCLELAKCYKYYNWSQAPWVRWVWVRAFLQGSSGWVWSKIKDQNLEKHSEGFVMLWICFSFKSHGNLTHVCDIINVLKYKEILNNILVAPARNWKWLMVFSLNRIMSQNIWTNGYQNVLPFSIRRSQEEMSNTLLV